MGSRNTFVNQLEQGLTEASPLFFGEVGVGGDDRRVLQSWIDNAVEKGLKKITASGDYLLFGSGKTVLQHSNDKAHPALDIPSEYALIVDGAKQLEIVFEGAVVASGCTPVLVYGSEDVAISGGSFSTNDGEGGVVENQSSSVCIVRSVRCSGVGQNVEGFYRGLFVYRSPASGFREFDIRDSLYYGAYGAGTYDLIDDQGESGQYFSDGSVRGGRYGNYFSDQTEVAGCKSFDCKPLVGNNARHFATETGGARWEGNSIVESSDQNAGSRISGFTPSSSIWAGGGIGGCLVSGNTVKGCYVAIHVSGVNGISVVDNEVSEYFMAGIAVVTDKVGGVDFNVKNARIYNNRVGAMAESSVIEAVGNIKRAGLMLEENQLVRFVDVECRNNVISVGSAGAVPDYSVYVEASGGIDGLGTNKGNGAGLVIPGWALVSSGYIATESIGSKGSLAEPFSVSASVVGGGVVRAYNSSMCLPHAEAGMRLEVHLNSSLCQMFVNDANTNAEGVDTIHLMDGSVTNKGVSFSGPAVISFVCSLGGQWLCFANHGGGQVSKIA